MKTTMGMGSVFVRFHCGCIGLVLEPNQQLPQRNLKEKANALVFKQCDPHEGEPSICCQPRFMELNQAMTPVTAEQVEDLTKVLGRLIADGHQLATVRSILSTRP